MEWSSRIIAAGLLSSISVAAQGADARAGKAAADARCLQCHEADDWSGEDAASLESLIRDIVAGKVKHKQKIELTPAQIADVAAYWADSSK